MRWWNEIICRNFHKKHHFVAQNSVLSPTQLVGIVTCIKCELVWLAMLQGGE